MESTPPTAPQPTIQERRAVSGQSLLAALAHVFRLERTWWAKGRQHQHVRYGMTSLPPCVASPHGLLKRRRKHWVIENRGHRAKDVSLGDDASLVHRGQGAAVCSVVRNAALSLLHPAGYHAITRRPAP